METFWMDEIEFVLDTRPGPERTTSEHNRFVLVKNKGCLDFYRNWRYQKPKTIMEIGMLQGGSMVFFDKLFAPDRLVGLDIRSQPIEPLEAYRENRANIRTFYGRSQDAPGTAQAARQNFSDGIDLVVDDASHHYVQTKATFLMLFPFVKTGGQYIIEDWAWSHKPGAQKAGSVWAEYGALTNLIFEFVVMAGSYGVIENVHVQKELVCITKGRGKLPENPFDLSAYTRGRAMPAL